MDTLAASINSMRLADNSDSAKELSNNQLEHADSALVGLVARSTHALNGRPHHVLVSNDR